MIDSAFRSLCHAQRTEHIVNVDLKTLVAIRDLHSLLLHINTNLGNIRYFIAISYSININILFFTEHFSFSEKQSMNNNIKNPH